MLRSLVGLALGACVLLAVSGAQAQCSKDTDCKGERVCEAGSCVAPSGGAAPAAAPAAPPAPPAAVAPVPVIANPAPMPAPEPPRRRRHSTGMMVGGIIMVSFSPIALLAAAVANAQQNACESDGFYFDGNGVTTYDGQSCSAYDKTIYGGLIAGVALLGGGIPMIVIGGKREPAPATAAITPWATRTAAGLGLRLEM